MNNFWRKIRWPFVFWRRRRKNDIIANLDFSEPSGTTSNLPSKIRLHLTRQFFTKKSTIGSLTINGKFQCWILEDPVRKTKKPKVTAIPAGIYRVIISKSNKLKKEMPEILDVPNFTGIRIHPGNKASDTEGCLLPGQTRARDFVGLSRTAYDELFNKIKHILKKETLYIQIENITRRMEA